MSEYEAEVFDCLHRGLHIDPFAVRGFLREVDQLRADKARLDWLLCEGTKEVVTPACRAKKVTLAYLNDGAESYRAAIDAAREGMRSTQA